MCSINGFSWVLVLLFDALASSLMVPIFPRCLAIVCLSLFLRFPNSLLLVIMSEYCHLPPVDVREEQGVAKWAVLGSDLTVRTLLLLKPTATPSMKNLFVLVLHVHVWYVTG